MGMPTCIPAPPLPGRATLEYLEHANLFIVPLDNERRWYRYHHLFAELLRQRLLQRLPQQSDHLAQYHIRASQWYEDNGLEIEAFQHAAAAHDVERAERLIEGKGTLLHFRGAVAPVLNWLESLPKAVLDAHPSLWTTYASVLLVSGQKTAAEQKLESAEAALRGAAPVPSQAGPDACRRPCRQDPGYDRTYRRHTGHDGCQSEPGGNHHRPVATRPGVSAPRQPVFPHLHHLEAWVCLPTPGQP